MARKIQQQNKRYPVAGGGLSEDKHSTEIFAKSFGHQRLAPSKFQKFIQEHEPIIFGSLFIQISTLTH